MKGRLVTEKFDYDGGRKATIYIPASPIQGIIYCGDGQLVTSWAEDLENDGTTSSVMLVGTHRLEDEMERLKEYTPVFDLAVFEAHEKFFLQVRNRVIEKYNVGGLSKEKITIYGVSASAELALALGSRHPDIFGSILCASPGAGYKPPSQIPASQPRTYLVAGKGEPFFADNAKRWFDALKEAGVEVVMEMREGEHGGKFWRDEFPIMVKWAFNL